MQIKRNRLASAALGLGVLGVGVAAAALSSAGSRSASAPTTTSPDPVVARATSARRTGWRLVTRSRLVAAVLWMLVIGAGVAFAAWSSTGSGSGTAQATTAANSVIAAGTSAADLFPGATKSITVTISNPNGYPVIVTSISAGSSALVNSTCAAASVTSDARTDGTGLAQTNAVKPIAAGGSGTYALTTHMIASPVDACQAQTFSLALTAVLTSNA